MTDDSMKKSLRKNFEAIVNLTFCDDLCKRFDQYKFVKCENHDYSVFSSHFDVTQAIMQKSNHKKIINFLENFYQQKKTKEDHVFFEWFSKRNYRFFEKLLTTRN